MWKSQQLPDILLEPLSCFQYILSQAGNLRLPGIHQIVPGSDQSSECDEQRSKYQGNNGHQLDQDVDGRA